MSGMYSGLNNNNSNQLSNEININVFSSFDPKKNRIISSGQKRRINLKDLYNEFHEKYYKEEEVWDTDQMSE